MLVADSNESPGSLQDEDRDVTMYTVLVLDKSFAVISDLSPATTYVFRVQALGPEGTPGSYSPEYEFQTERHGMPPLPFPPLPDPPPPPPPGGRLLPPWGEWIILFFPPLVFVFTPPLCCRVINGSLVLSSLQRLPRSPTTPRW